MKTTLLASLLILATPALGDVSVVFSEGAPKDRFTLTNTSDCAIGPAKVTLDLATAPAGLIFDVTGEGAGVEVFQPFELVSGAGNVTASPSVTDGQQTLEMGLSGLGAGESVAFTIDLDDTTSDRQITVSGSEIAGTSVKIETERLASGAVFTDKAQAVLSWSDCSS